MKYEMSFDYSCVVCVLGSWAVLIMANEAITSPQEATASNLLFIALSQTISRASSWFGRLCSEQCKISFLHKTKELELSERREFQLFFESEDYRCVYPLVHVNICVLHWFTPLHCHGSFSWDLPRLPWLSMQACRLICTWRTLFARSREPLFCFKTH